MSTLPRSPGDNTGAKPSSIKDHTIRHIATRIEKEVQQQGDGENGEERRRAKTAKTSTSPL